MWGGLNSPPNMKVFGNKGEFNKYLKKSQL